MTAVPSETDAPVADVPEPARTGAQAASVARQTLMKRLADVVCLPESRINAFERSVTADLLVEMLRDAPKDDRKKVARRLRDLSELPASLARLLLLDEPDIAAHLITDCETLNEADLYYCARNGSEAHRQMLAARKDIGPMLSEVLAENGEVPVLAALLRNTRAMVSQTTMETAVALSRTRPDLVALIMRRSELRPSSAYVMFWWVDEDVRRLILSRFSVNREIMQDAAADVFHMAATEGWNDPLSRKALQFIERRQRNREAIARSPYDSLEAALSEAAAHGLTRNAAEEIAYLSGIKPSTAAKILRDKGGEGLAVLCKATGLRKASLRHLWQALRRPLEKDGETHPHLERVILAYDLLAVDRAQTILRYWNWALSSALTPAMIRAISSGEHLNMTQLSVPERAALLVFADDLRT